MEAARPVFHPGRVPVRVLIVDDHCEFRGLVRALLTQRGYRVVGEAASGGAALESAARLRPDAILLDVQLGPENGFEVSRALRDALPSAAILLVSNADFAPCDDLLRFSGASGFLVKDRLASVDLSAYSPGG